MGSVETVEIDAPVRRVWEVLTDVERWPEWTDSFRRIEFLDGTGPLTVDSVVRAEQPRLRPALWRVDSLVTDQEFTWHSHTPGLTTVAGHRFTALAPGRTRVVFTVDLRGVLAPVGRLFWGGMIGRYVRTEAVGLKRRCEQPARR